MIVILAGVAGSGKTTVGRLLAERMKWEFADGDSFHSAANVEKMRRGIPLTDADRWPWLRAIGTWMDQRIGAGESAIVACSALKRAYRDALLDGRPGVRMVFLDISEQDDEDRLRSRHGHFFPEKLLDSQFTDLEMPQESERLALLHPSRTPEQTVADVMGVLGLRLGRREKRLARTEPDPGEADR